MHIEHVYSYMRGNTLYGTLDRYAAAGFCKHPHTARHTWGRHCGFLGLTGTYLEFIAIEDSAAFQAAPPREQWFHAYPRPCGLAIAAQDPTAIFYVLRDEHPDLASPQRHKRADDPASPDAWEFFEFPAGATPGTFTFAVKYLQRSMDSHSVTMGTNSVFALGGVIFCTTAATSPLVAQWQQTLNHWKPCTRLADRQLEWGAHTLRWIDPMEYTEYFGRPWNPGVVAGGDLCAIRLLAESVTAAQAAFAAAGFPTRLHTATSTLYIPPDKETGYAFVIDEVPISTFIARLSEK